MSRNVVEPQTVKVNSAVSETVTTHPAYAQIGVHRVSGGHKVLYDSDFQHQHYVVIRIARSQLHRGLNRDWHFERDELIEVALSEAQWATFVSSPNMGSGVPCTLQRLKGEEIPKLPDPINRADQFGTELSNKLAGCQAVLDDLLAQISDSGLSKVKQQQLTASVHKVKQEIGCNANFVVEQFDEHTETTIEKAKQELHGYMTHAIQRAGLATLTEGKLPLQLAENKETEK